MTAPVSTFPSVHLFAWQLLLRHSPRLQTLRITKGDVPMSRYLGALLGVIALLALYSIVNSQAIVQQLDRGVRASRNSISANPAAAADGAFSVEGAGQNVTRQTSEDGMQPVPNTTPSQDANATAPNTTEADEAAQPAPAPQPATTTTTPPANPEAIPALW